jgi:hypothetical protein
LQFCVLRICISFIFSVPGMFPYSIFVSYLRFSYSSTMLLSYCAASLQCYTHTMLRRRFYDATMLRCYNATMLQCYNATMRQCCNATMLLCYNATMLLCYNATMLLCYNATMLQCFAHSYCLGGFSFTPSLKLCSFSFVAFWPIYFILAAGRRWRVKLEFFTEAITSYC